MTDLCPRIVAADASETLTIFVGDVTANVATRRISGPAVVYGQVGRTSKGPLRVRRGALQFPANLADVILTEEHDRAKSRGNLAALEHTQNGIRASFQVADGPEGDKALAEAGSTRRGLSFDIVDAQIVGDEIVTARVIAFGQVGIPAFDGLYIDAIAA